MIQIDRIGSDSVDFATQKKDKLRKKQLFIREFPSVSKGNSNFNSYQWIYNAFYY